MLGEDLASLGTALDIAREELRMNEALFKDGDVSRLEILRTRRQFNEIEARVASVRNKYRQEASAEVAKIEEELASAGSKQAEQQSFLDHTDLVAPTDDALIIEAKVELRDVGGLHSGLPVSVKIETFDYAVYGTLNGTLSYTARTRFQSPSPPASLRSRTPGCTWSCKSNPASRARLATSPSNPA